MLATDLDGGDGGGDGDGDGEYTVTAVVTVVVVGVVGTSAFCMPRLINQMIPPATSDPITVTGNG